MPINTVIFILCSGSYAMLDTVQSPTSLGMKYLVARGGAA